jgi:hypothetical protein
MPAGESIVRLFLRLCAVALLGLTLAGCDKCGDFIFKSQACRGDMPRQQ